ncbi:MAG: PEGA domain-containing protein [Bacteroidota bacterium]
MELRKVFHHPDLSSFTVEEGKTVSFQRTLKPRFGYLNVSSDIPNSKVYLDNKLIGNAPVKKFQLESILHNVKIEAEQYHPHLEEFVIADGEEKIISVHLNPTCTQ